MDADVSNFESHLAKRQLEKSIGEWSNAQSETVRCDGSDGGKEPSSHPLDERILKEDREPLRGQCARLLRIQLIKIHRTLRVAPAMAAGVTDRLWEVADLVAGKPQSGEWKEQRDRKP